MIVEQSQQPPMIHTLARNPVGSKGRLHEFIITLYRAMIGDWQNKKSFATTARVIDSCLKGHHHFSRTFSACQAPFLGACFVFHWCPPIGPTSTLLQERPDIFLFKRFSKSFNKPVIASSYAYIKKNRISWANEIQLFLFDDIIHPHQCLETRWTFCS